jgi:hypothetical protein
LRQPAGCTITAIAAADAPWHNDALARVKASTGAGAEPSNAFYGFVKRARMMPCSFVRLRGYFHICY